MQLKTTARGVSAGTDARYSWTAASSSSGWVPKPLSEMPWREQTSKQEPQLWHLSRSTTTRLLAAS